jgi:HEAT repeat protein
MSDIAALAREAVHDLEKRRRLLEIAGDRTADLGERRAALQAVRELAFTSRFFGPINVELITTLRNLLDEPDQQLRETAASMLAQRKDEFVQRRLLDGLERRDTPLVDDPKAIALLGYDIHAAFFPTMRRLAKESPDQATRLEAIKLLAADPSSADLLMDVFDDKGEDDEVRRASASALMSVARDRFEPRAKEAVLDESDSEPVRAASLTALTHFADPAGLAGDSEFIAGVANVDTSGSSRLIASADEGGEADFEVREGDLAKAVRTFKKRYGLS